MLSWIRDVIRYSVQISLTFNAHVGHLGQTHDQHSLAIHKGLPVSSPWISFCSCAAYARASLVSAARLGKFDRVCLLRQLQHDRRRLLELVAEAARPIAHHVLIGVIFPAFAHLDVECYLMREATRRNQRPSRGHQRRPSEAIRGHQRPSEEAIRGHQRRPSEEAIRGIRGHLRGSSLDVERYRLLRRLVTNHHVAQVVFDLAVLVILRRAVGCGHQV